MVDKIVAAKSDLRNAQVQEQKNTKFVPKNILWKFYFLAGDGFQGYFQQSSYCPKVQLILKLWILSSNYFLHFRNDNLHMDGSKEIWNSNKSNLNKVSL